MLLFFVSFRRASSPLAFWAAHGRKERVHPTPPPGSCLRFFLSHIGCNTFLVHQISSDLAHSRARTFRDGRRNKNKTVDILAGSIRTNEAPPTTTLISIVKTPGRSSHRGKRHLKKTVREQPTRSTIQFALTRWLHYFILSVQEIDIVHMTGLLSLPRRATTDARTALSSRFTIISTLKSHCAFCVLMLSSGNDKNTPRVCAV